MRGGGNLILTDWRIGEAPVKTTHTQGMYKNIILQKQLQINKQQWGISEKFLLLVNSTHSRGSTLSNGILALLTGLCSHSQQAFIVSNYCWRFWEASLSLWSHPTTCQFSALLIWNIKQEQRCQGPVRKPRPPAPPQGEQREHCPPQRGVGKSRWCQSDALVRADDHERPQ